MLRLLSAEYAHIAVWAFFTVFFTASAEASEFLCRQLSINEGLSQCNVLSIVRDKQGFLWIGTRFGLNRYDFSQVESYYNNTSDPNSIPDNVIQKLFVDSHGTLWVAGEKGLAVFNPISNTFKQMKVEGSAPEVHSFMQDGDALIMGDRGAILRYDYRTELITRLPATGCPQDYINAIHPWQPGYYLLATRWNGLWLYDRTHGSCRQMPGFNERFIMATYLDSHGRLWISEYGEGVFCYGRDGSRTHILKTSNSKLSNDIVLDIAEVNGQMWFATDGGGICIYDPASASFSDNGAGAVLRSMGSVTSMYIDDYSNIYAGTVRDGAMTVRNVAIHTFQSGSEPTLKFSAVSGYKTDSDGTIWIADDGQGIYRHSEGSNHFELIKATAGQKVTDIAAYDHATLIFAVFDKGLFLLDKATGSVRPAPDFLNDFYAEKMHRGLGLYLRNLPDGRIALIYDDITTFRPGDKAVKTCKKSKAAEIAPFYDDKGMILCRGANFISSFDALTDNYKVLYRSDERIFCATFDGDSVIYFATNRGLDALNIYSGAIRQVEGPTIGRISSLVLEDRRLWIGTSTNLYLKDIDSHNLMSFGRADGVAANEYLPYSTMITDRYVYMGGVNGLMRIDRREIAGHYDAEGPLAISVSGVAIDGNPMLGNVKNGCLDVASSSSSVKISVIGNGGNALRRRLYRFIVRGGGSDRTIETYDNFVNLNFLQPGEDYEISATAALPTGVWPQEQKLLKLAVLAPWYRSPWVIGLTILLMCASLVYFELQRRRRHERKILKHLDDYRNSALENEVAFLVNTNYALRNPLTMIYAPAKMLIERLRKGEQVDMICELEGICRNTRKMRDAIDMALELHHVGAGPAAANQSTRDICEALDSALAAKHSEIELKNIEVRVNRPAEELLAFDAERTAVVFETLIHTAVRRSPDSAVIYIAVHGTSDNKIRIEVRDSGTNLDDEQLSRLFSSHFNDGDATLGNSLGLAYARSIVEARGGHIGVHNNEGTNGVTIWAEIPAGTTAIPETNPTKTVPPAPSASISLANVDTSGLTAFVVDEDKDLCLFVASQLAPHFKKVLHAFNGKDAMLLIRQNQPDIVISSVLLPIKSGLELCHDLKANPDTNHIPVILLTSVKEALESGYDAGADSYLTKPFDINLLVSRCRNLLRTRSVIRERYSRTPAPESRMRQLPNADESFLLKIDRLIAENLSQPDFGVDSLIELMNTSRTALYSKFKAITGGTVGAYITDFRLKRAKEMLCDRDISVTDIAEELGFSSQRYFSTFFKERTGMSPSAFRNSQSENKQKE